MKIIAFIIGFIFTASLAHAEMTVKNYQGLKGSIESKLYVAGVGSGIEWTNGFLMANAQQQIYCQPNTFALTPENLVNILAKELEIRGDMVAPTDPIEVLLLYSLIRTFPCHPK